MDTHEVIPFLERRGTTDEEYVALIARILDKKFPTGNSVLLGKLESMAGHYGIRYWTVHDVYHAKDRSYDDELNEIEITIDEAEAILDHLDDELTRNGDEDSYDLIEEALQELKKEKDELNFMKNNG